MSKHLIVDPVILTIIIFSASGKIIYIENKIRIKG